MRLNASNARTIQLALLGLVVAVASTSLLAPATASAAPQATAIRCADPAALPPSCEVPNPQVSSDHVGWAYLSFYSCGSYECERQTAWAWTTTGWSPTSLGRGWVYLSPYSGQWRWAWRQSTGWVAIYGGRLTKRETSSNWYPSAGCPQCQ